MKNAATPTTGFSGQEKIYNKTEMKSVRHFTAAAHHLTSAFMIITILVKVVPLRAIKPKLINQRIQSLKIKHA